MNVPLRNIPKNKANLKSSSFFAVSLLCMLIPGIRDELLGKNAPPPPPLGCCLAAQIAVCMKSMQSLLCSHNQKNFFSFVYFVPFSKGLK